jgi:hypothetical protein
MFARAFAGLNLTPLERAILKFLEMGVIAGVVALAPIFAQLANQQTPDWATFLRLAGATFATAFLGAIWKYLKAQGDPPLPPPQVTIQQTPAGLTVSAAPQPAPTAPSTAPAAASAL